MNKILHIFLIFLRALHKLRKKSIVQFRIKPRYKFRTFTTLMHESLIALAVARESKTMSNKRGTRQNTVLVLKTMLNEPVVSITSDR